MDAEAFIFALNSAVEEKYGMPLAAKLKLSPEECRAWLMSLYRKNLTLQDAEQTVEAIIEGRMESGDMDDYLLYI